MLEKKSFKDYHYCSSNGEKKYSVEKKDPSPDLKFTYWKFFDWEKKNFHVNWRIRGEKFKEILK